MAGLFLRMEGGVTRHGKVGRNDLCPCNSGKKYKRCCGSEKAETSQNPTVAPKVDPLALDRMFDQAAQRPFETHVPRLLYHYTSWAGARGIISTQQFWATAHDCTNDEAELVSADSIIMDVAQHMRSTMIGAAAEVLDLFLNGYPTLQVTKLIAAYLVCFSVARDDAEQWEKYGDNGRGVCLGLRVLDETPPDAPDTGAATVQVDYSEASSRATLAGSFKDICSLLSRANVLVIPENVKLGLSALYRAAAFASIMAKRENWAVEQEVRHVTIVHKDANIQPKKRQSNGREISFLPVPVRSGGKRIAFAEILIGPNQNIDHAIEEMRCLLADSGYSTGEMEYPEINASVVAPWDR